MVIGLLSGAIHGMLECQTALNSTGREEGAAFDLLNALEYFQFGTPRSPAELHLKQLQIKPKPRLLRDTCSFDSVP